jgi:cysteinyl-tRNA synthetase
MYVCGPTVYAPSHVGHLRTYLLFDLTKRYFLSQGRKVHHIQNITDFEDKITHQALAENLPWSELSHREASDFARLMAKVGILPPDRMPLSSEYVGKMIDLIRRLERRGFAYRRNGSIYFDASKVTETRNFSAEDFLTAHAVPESGRVAEPEANDPRDFILWRPSVEPAPVWDSPWGRGMPGWHIECFAMASDNMRLPMDLHGGGLDLIFPHHYAENLISLALTNKLIARNFLHSAFVTMDARKMAKSTGNLVTIEEALGQICPWGLRYYLMTKSYEERLEFSMYEAHQAEESWQEDQAALSGLLATGGQSGYPVERLETASKEFYRALASNLETPEVLNILHELTVDIRRSGTSGIARGEHRAARKILTGWGTTLGLPLLGENSGSEPH